MKSNNKLTQKELKRQLHYDQETGIFTRLISNNSKNRIGEIVGNLDKPTGYIRISINKLSYRAHRLAWLYVFGEFPEQFIDHINGIRHDNRIKNLREATIQENCYNKSINKNNKSGYKGVSWHKQHKKWQAKLSINNKIIFLGLFDDPKIASKVYEKYAKENFGKFYKINLNQSAQPIA